MDQHVRQFGILTIAMSVLCVLLGIVLFAVPDVLARETGWSGLRFVAIGLGIYNIVVAVPSVFAAFGLLKFQEWARNVLIVISALNILNIPFGPVVGAYGLWVLLSPETDPLFTELQHPHSEPPHKAGRGTAGHHFESTRQDERTNPILPSNADLHP